MNVVSKTKTWKQIIKNPTIIVFIISLTFVVFNIYLAQRTRPYTSDDISWQNILTTWNPWNGHIVDMGSKDNFLVNVPALMLLGHIFHASRTLLFVEASIFAVFNFTLFYLVALYLLKKCRINISYETLFPFVWLASLGYNFAQLYLNAAWRDFEVGVSFMYFALVIRLYYGEIDILGTWTSRVLTVLAGIIAGIFIYSDPYFLYFTVGPIALLFLVLYLAKKATSRQALIVVGVAVFSMLVDRLMKSAAARIGLFSPQGSSISLIHISHLFSEFVATLGEMTTIFGASVTGVHIFSMSGLASLLNLVIIIAVTTWLAIFVYKHRKRQTDVEGDTLSPLVLTTSFFGSLFMLVFIGCLLDGEDDYRYFVLSVYLLAVLVAFILGRLKRNSIMFIILIWTAICINLVTSVFALTPIQSEAIESGNKANVANYSLIQELTQLGLRKGYANYWNGNINTYLSNGTVNVLPVTCINGKTTELRLLVDTYQFQVPSNRSYYIDDPSQTSPAMCSITEVKKQFGRPSETIFFQKKTVLVYNYDIVTRMQEE